MNGNVYSSVAGDTDYWWRYGETTAYGSETEHRIIAISDKDPHPVSERLSGLAAETAHHFQMCARDQQENPGRVVCSKDQTFTTKTAGTLSCAPVALTFADPGTGTEDQNVTCTASDGWLTTGTVDLGVDQAFSASNGCDNLTLAPGASCTIVVGFPPADVPDFQMYNATLSVPHDGTNAAPTVTLTGFRI